MADQDLYGTAGRWPLRVTEAGQLETVSGEAALWQGVERVLDTAIGERPLDPTFGSSIAALDPIDEAEVLALQIGRALERSEPRIKDIRVDLVREDVANGTLELEVWITPIDTNVPLNRTFPFYRKS